MWTTYSWNNLFTSFSRSLYHSSFINPLTLSLPPFITMIYQFFYVNREREKHGSTEVHMIQDTREREFTLYQKIDYSVTFIIINYTETNPPNQSLNRS